MPRATPLLGWTPQGLTPEGVVQKVAERGWGLWPYVAEPSGSTEEPGSLLPGGSYAVPGVSQVQQEGEFKFSPSLQWWARAWIALSSGGRMNSAFWMLGVGEENAPWKSTFH